MTQDQGGVTTRRMDAPTLPPVSWLTLARNAAACCFLTASSLVAANATLA